MSFDPFESHLTARLQLLATRKLLRDPERSFAAQAAEAARAAGLEFLDAGSNDYLGFAHLDVSRETSGAGSSRLLAGGSSRHAALEHSIAAWLGCGGALLFSSGFAANVGTLAALAGPQDTILSDALNHASIIDGCRLSRASVQIVPHLDLDALRAQLVPRSGTTWFVTESYFSMDGSSPDLPAVSELCRARGAHLVVDEAHALGVFGPQGRGLCAASGVTPDVLIGTFGKAFGAQGAFVAGVSALRTLLWNTARSFVFSTAPSPALAATVHARLPMVIQADRERAHLADLGAHLDALLSRQGWALPARRHGPIFPILVGSPERALSLAERCAASGLHVPAIRPPTVPEGQSRLRLTLKATLDHGHVERLATALAPFAGER